MIGIFDSGLGGLTAMAELRLRRPDLDIFYYADTAHLPYGTRSDEDIRRLAEHAVTYLAGRGADVILIACGTVSSVTLPLLQNKCNIPLIGVVEPTAHLACHISRSGNIGILGTTATIRSHAFERACATHPEIRTHSVACPLFVAMVENGFTSPRDPVVTAAVAHYLSPLRDVQMDTLILGCTHFPHLAAAITAYLPHVTLIGAGEAAADALLATRPRVGHGNTIIEVSHAPSEFARVAEQLLGAPLPTRVRLKK